MEDYSLINDEVFFIHDIDASNHRIYFRQYVCPEAIIQSVSGSTITVDDASVFRVGYKLIFGTGNNRNVLTITAINNASIGDIVSVKECRPISKLKTWILVTDNANLNPDSILEEE